MRRATDMCNIMSLFWAILCTFAMAGLCPRAIGQPVTAIPQGGTPILRNPLDTFAEPRENATGSVRVVSATGPGFAQALEVESKVKGSNWEHQLMLGLASPLKKGDVLLVHYWARTRYTADESGQSMIRTGIEVRGLWKRPRKERELLAPLTQGVLTAAGSTWQQYFIRAECPRDMPAKEVFLMFRCGSERQRVQFGGQGMLNYGSAMKVDALPVTRYSYAGREPNAP